MNPGIGAARQGAVLPPAGTLAASLPAADVAKAWKSAKDFEAMALNQFLSPMFDTLDAKGGFFGGGEAEQSWRPMLVDAMAKQIAAAGGLGIAQPVFQEMLRMQEQGNQAGLRQARGAAAAAMRSSR